MTTMMRDNTQSQLKKSQDKLRSEKDSIANQYYMEKDNLLKVEDELNRLREQEDALAETIQDKDEAVAEYDRMIEESERAYSKLVENSSKLLSALERESQSLRERTRPNRK